MIDYFLDSNKNYKGFNKHSVFHRCVKYCAGVENPNAMDHPWFGPPNACRNSERDCSNNQICNFYDQGINWYSFRPDLYDESYNWGWKMIQAPWDKSAWSWVGRASIGDSGCIDCPGTTAESCRDEGYYVNRRTFEDCIDICAGGRNPNNVQMHESNTA